MPNLLPYRWEFDRICHMWNSGLLTLGEFNDYLIKLLSSILYEEAEGKPTDGELSVIITETQLEQAATEGIMEIPCPNCRAYTTAEPDADYVYCKVCNMRIKVINPFI